MMFVAVTNNGPESGNHKVKTSIRFGQASGLEPGRLEGEGFPVTHKNQVSKSPPIQSQ